LITSADNLPLFPDRDKTSAPAPFFHETLVRESGYRLIAGVDEAGRGPLSGPVVAAAVMLPEGTCFEGVRDSKKMTASARERAFSIIAREAVAVGIGVVSHEFIDRFNILKASLEAMRRALSYLDPAPDYLLVDGLHRVPWPAPQRCLKKGDEISHTISAASVIAKVYRDRLMRAYHACYPDYGFAENKGYGTKHHLQSLRLHGPSPIHRLSFKGVLV
jgi:ribonuclease HII